MGLISTGRRFFRGTKVQRWYLVTSIYRLYSRWIVRSLPRTDLGVLVAFRGEAFEIERGDITILPTLATGEYEAWEIDTFLQSIQAGGTFIDVGANIGIYTILARRAVGSTGRVIAFEPNWKTRIFLERNIKRAEKLYPLLTEIEVYPLALSSKSGRFSFEESPFLGTAHLASDAAQEHLDIVGSEVSETWVTTTLDEFLDRRPELVPSAIKIDVEGFEPEVIVGACESLRKHKPTLILEVSRRNSDSLGVDWGAAMEILEDTYSTARAWSRGKALYSSSPSHCIMAFLNGSDLVNVVLTAEGSA